MSKSEKNLLDAFAGESQGNGKYLAFAKKADAEGFKQIAKLFRAMAAAEMIHAHNHLREIGGIKTTREDLVTALQGETYSFQKIYPYMIEDAQAEGNKGALRTLTYANEAEKIHAALCQKAIDEFGRNSETDYYVCDVCGYTIEGEPPAECPVCKAKKQAFKKVE